MNSACQLAVAAILVVIALSAHGVDLNGFSLEGSLIPDNEIHTGGPSRDGIPAIDKPRFVEPANATFLQDDDRVLGITRNGVSKVYPVAILNWHEIVNDHFADEPIVVTFCPLCGTGMAYLATVNRRVLDFGVSGLLYNSDMLLYDRETQSLWSQIMRQAISGPMKGMRLQPVPIEHTTWADWKQRYPETRVLSTETGYRRDYMRNPYEGYGISRKLYFPVDRQDQRYHPKEPVLGIELAGRHKAYPFKELRKSGGAVEDTLGGQRITVRYDQRYNAATAMDARGKLLPAVTAYWFAWYAFHPETAVYVAE